MFNIKRMTALLMSAILMGSTVCVPAMAAEVTGEEQVVLQEEGTKQEEDLETDSTADSETEGETTELPEDLESGEKTANAAENVTREAAEPGEQDDKPENAAEDVTTSAAEPEEPGAAEAAEGKQPEIASTDIQESSGAGNTEIIAGTDAAVQEDKYLPIVIVDGVTDGTSDVAYGASATWDAEKLETLQKFDTDVSTASDGCMMMGLPGEYIGDQQAILDRINAIRIEACEQNIINPETGRPLTMDDYVPLKWSHELEEIARIRAAETSMTADHIRTNGDSWQSVDSEYTYVGECVAWNYDSSATAGIDQWYNEKEKWMNGDENGSRHYTTLIRPSMRYVGGATFYSPCTEYPTTTLVEFYTMYDGDDLDETFVGQVGECVQKLEVNEGNIQGDPYIKGTLSGVKGDDRPLFLMTNATYSGFFTANTKELLFVDDVNWSSSNSEIASVSSDGFVTAKKCGSATITAQAENGASASAEFTVEHVLQKVPAVEATCTEAGNIEYWSCENCGKLFRDSECTQEISQAETVVAAGHDLSKTEAKAATCTEAGNNEYWTCSECEKIFSDESGETEIGQEEIVVAAKGHSWSSWTVTKKATCTENGSRERTCANCGGKETEAITATGHQWNSTYNIDKEATCTEEGSKSKHCSVCNAINTSTVSSISATGHAYGDWKVTKAATCTENGSRERNCANCEGKETETISALGHVWNEDNYTVDKEATCTEAGSESIHCSVCDAIDESTVREIGTKPHKYGKWIVTKAATCTENGSRERVCKNCGNKETETLSAGHKWNLDYTIDKEGTCIEDGSESIHCSVCGAIDESTVRPIWKTPHRYGNWKVTKAATCTVDGSREETCLVCGVKYTETIKATGHKWKTTYTTDKKPTASSNGSKSIHCSVCGSIKPGSVQSIPRLTGSWKKDSTGWWYSWSDGSYPAGKFENIGGKTYYFNKAGYMVTGWQYIGGKWYYFNSDGAMRTGWLYDGGVWYYLNGSGVMVTGLQKIGSATYYFNGSGAMQTGWQQIAGKWYYFNSDGAMRTGWLYDGGGWDYLNGSGVMVTGLQRIGGIGYYFNRSGAMQTGWQYIGGKWYYFDGSGAMAVNRWVGDYYLTGNGVMATNTWIGKYYVGADGKWIPGYKR